MRGSRNPPAPTKKTSVENTLVFCFIRYLKFHPQGWIRTAAEPTAACGGNREARLGQRSAFSKPCQGAAEKAASATRKPRRTVRCNSDDRCQRQMQGGAVGAAASGMRVPPKARRSRWEPRPGFLFIPRGSRYPPGQTLFHSPLKNAQTKTTVRVDGGSVIEKNRRGAGRVSGQAPAGSWQNPPV